MKYVDNKETVKRARGKYGHTVEQAAALVGYDWRSWYRWEDGTRRMGQHIFDTYIDRANALQGKRKRKRA